MNNPRLAGRYAKSLLDLALEQNQVPAVYADMKWLQSVCSTNRDFVNVLSSPIIKADKKQVILNAVTNGRVSALTSAFIDLLVKKTRESNLQEIVHAFIDQYNSMNNIQKVKITTAAPLTDNLKEEIMKNVKAALPGKSFEIETAIKDELIGGFIVETSGQLVDASILRDLKDIKKQFMDNEFIHRIR
ncbi:MAG: ATP synthase F1 subunit delta [Bacteroidetes bacterium]|nr:ATP synthase F1 subunit delta [Bacteroidota bacterium]